MRRVDAPIYGWFRWFRGWVLRGPAGAFCGVQLSRAGRKRKLNAARYPNGQVSRETLDSPRVVAASMPHRLGLSSDSQTDQRAESQLGRMRLRGQISETQFLAGQRFSQVVGAYLATITPPSQLGGRGRGYECSGLPDCPDCICTHRRAVYMAAFDRLIAVVGRRGSVAVKTVAIEDRPCPFYLLQPLNWGLSALSHHFGIGR